MMQNPYLNRTMITAPTEFYGRHLELQKLFSRIGNPRPQSVAVVGERRIGKSSLLYQAYLPNRSQNAVSDTTRQIAVFLDLSARKDYTVRQIFQAIFDALAKQIEMPGDGGTGTGYDLFEAVVEQLMAAGQRLVIFFDEFEAIANNPNIPAATVTEFLAFLRGIANSRAVAYVTSSHVDLQELGHSGEIKESPFFNIFTRISLGPLQTDEALRLIGEPSAAAGRALGPYAPVAMEWAGTHPYFLQIACAALFDQHNGGEITVTGLAEARHEFSEQAEDQFLYIWQHLSEDERVVLRASAAGESLPPSRAFARRGLEKRGYVQVRHGQPAVFSSIFAEHIPEWETQDPHQPPDRIATQAAQIEALLAGLQKDDPRYAEISTLQTQLNENVAKTGLLGDTEVQRADRNRILHELNRLSLEVLGRPLSQLLS